jgi:uncharacterized protein with PQ loop repeat
MKTIKITYWILTALMTTFIFLGAVIDVIKSSEAVAFIRHLGYPEYFVRFIGILKIMGVLAILLPVHVRLKEWAYAGLVFDVFGAIYSHLSIGDGLKGASPAVIGLLLVVASNIMFLFTTVKFKQNAKIN